MKSFLHYYLKTFKDIIANQSILTTLILSVIFYSVFYPTAYKAQQAEALPIVIVDEEQSIVTNNIIQQVSLSPNVEVKAVTGNFLDAVRNNQSQHCEQHCPSRYRHILHFYRNLIAQWFNQQHKYN
jgi:ABC-2 type transport system permease protein